MREHWYRPGGEGWMTFAASGTLLAVEPSQHLQVAELWHALEGGFQRVLDTLTEKGFSATPSFALLAWSDAGELRAIVRGPAKLRVESREGERSLDGTGVSTWSEMLFGRDTRFELELPGTPEGNALPLVAGAVTAVRVSSDAQAAERPLETAAPAPAAAPTAATPPPAPVPETTVADVWDEENDNMLGESSETQELDELLGATIHRSDAAEHPPVPGAAQAAGDHDGMTIVAGDLRRLRAERRAAASATPPEAPPQQATLRLELSNGTVETLDQTVIVGRSPSANKVSGGALPRLVTIPGDKDISRNHVQFAVEGDTVVVTDLHSRNGTQVVLPGRAPQQLRQGEPTTIIVGTLVDLGGGVTLTLREGA
ncbi:FHA domain-containing protein [Salinibacterium sp. dk2585]|uniref:FHA domain-containing protein n=1 Tax=unclassified Salinibacterium TaxID=2632331 RepID=UPI0011C25390|nr:MULTISPECIES: FHA domain-containing protein [unclassified Salinibacterium]QEE60937.1 FHA domain-containing protein [Salinibacterium sp. dk2585]TXK56008.1 FHA domain-containing protein [Salinibacterium sp. dk5596]